MRAKAGAVSEVAYDGLSLRAHDALQRECNGTVILRRTSAMSATSASERGFKLCDGAQISFHRGELV